MRRPTSVLVVGSVAALTVALLAASSTQHHAGTKASPSGQVSLLAARPAAPPQAPPIPSGPESLDSRAERGMLKARESGADISIAVLDRQTGQLVTRGDGAPFPTASVSKLFIADDLLMGLAQARLPLSVEDSSRLDAMLRASDDFAAGEFWQRGGGNAIITRITERYGLRETTPPYDGNWWSTMSTTADLVRYYDKLINGSGGLPAQQADIILADLAASAPVGVDGYPQRFGIPDGLFDEPVAVKQGWMCCWNGPNQVHLSTGVAGTDRRFAIAIAAMQPVDEATARDTITDVLRTMFPGGRI
ncbi:MAG: hypothetical protein KDB50_08915 [Mycobacterium sp.]|nr:hypothetical protein [Mycobacterium sp.]